MPPSPTDQLLTANDAADYINVNLQTLYAWRHRGAGPRALKAGRKLRYRRKDFDEWLEEETATYYLLTAVGLQRQNRVRGVLSTVVSMGTALRSGGGGEALSRLALSPTSPQRP